MFQRPKWDTVLRWPLPVHILLRLERTSLGYFSRYPLTFLVLLNPNAMCVETGVFVSGGQCCMFTCTKRGCFEQVLELTWDRAFCHSLLAAPSLSPDFWRPVRALHSKIAKAVTIMPRHTASHTQYQIPTPQQQNRCQLLLPLPSPPNYVVHSVRIVYCDHEISPAGRGAVCPLDSPREDRVPPPRAPEAAAATPVQLILPAVAAGVILTRTTLGAGARDCFRNCLLSSYRLHISGATSVTSFEGCVRHSW